VFFFVNLDGMVENHFLGKKQVIGARFLGMEQFAGQQGVGFWVKCLGGASHGLSPKVTIKKQYIGVKFSYKVK